MSNKINGTHHGIIDRGTQRASEATRGDKAQASDGASKGAATATSAGTVVLTDRSQLLERIEKSLSEMPAIDRAKVEAVKADIAEGRYEIDVDNIVDIMLRTEHEFDE